MVSIVYKIVIRKFRVFSITSRRKEVIFRNQATITIRNEKTTKYPKNEKNKTIFKPATIFNQSTYGRILPIVANRTRVARIITQIITRIYKFALNRL